MEVLFVESFLIKINYLFLYLGKYLDKILFDVINIRLLSYLHYLLITVKSND